MTEIYRGGSVSGASSPPIVWVCIAVHNRVNYTRTCLSLLRRQCYPRVQVLVVDDGSTDGTSELLRREHPEVIVIQGDGSLYWTGAMHNGIAHILTSAGSDDYVLLLNNDLTFEPEFIQTLVHASRAHPRSLIQAVESCVDDPELIWSGGLKVNWWTAKHCLTNFHRRLSEFPQGYVETSDWVTGRGVLVPTEVFRTAGNYDKSYKQHGDPEFARRAAKYGYSSIVSYDARVLSYEKGTGLNEARCFTLTDLKRYYFGVLSYTRLLTRWKLAMDMTDSWLQGVVYFGFDLARITWHFVSRLRSQPCLE